MKSTRILFFLLAVATCGLAQQQSKPVPNPYRVQITADRPDHRYDTGETVTFEILAVDSSDNNRAMDFGSVDFGVFDGLKLIEKDTLGVTGKSLKIEATVTRPGFVRCEAAFTGGGQASIRGRAVVAVSPEEISPSREFPVDFEAFWTEQKARLAEVELAPELTAFETKNPKLETFDVKIPCGDEIRPVSGYFSRPKAAAAKSLPIVLWVHGAGVRSAMAGQAEVGAVQNFLSMDINAHGIENGQSPEFYKQLFSVGFLKNYPLQGRENRDGYYFRGMFLRLVRALDFLTAQPEWDGKTVAVIGHSQGGAQAIVAGGLDDRVTFIGAGVPAMCDHTGLLRKRLSGWPKVIPLDQATQKPDPQVAEMSRYFDGVNFASRYHGEAIFSVGFVDMVCPPSSVYSAYNQLRGEKRIINEPKMGHAAPEEIQLEFLNALKAHAVRDSKSE